MSVAACAELVERRDPDRYRGIISAPVKARPGLITIYAFNTEIVSAAWAAKDPALAEIRLQYWHDQIEALFQGKATDAHPVLDALRQLAELHWLAKRDFTELINARRWDAHSEPFADETALRAYLGATSGNLIAMAARILGMNDHYDSAMREYGYAAGLARFFQAVPELKASGRHPLPDESAKALHVLATDALAKMDATKKHRLIRMALPAMLPASEARPVLKMVIRDPSLVFENRLTRAPFQRRWRAMWCEILGRW